MVQNYNYQQNINGWVYGWSDIAIKVNGEVYTQIESISYDTTINREDMIGTSPEIVGKTLGYATYKGSFTMSLEDADYFLYKINPWASAQFTITVSYSNYSKPIVTDTLIECCIDSISLSASKGGAIKKQFNISMKHIDQNGSSAY